MLKYTYITDLLPVYPPFKLSQQKTLDWVASTHTEAESLAKGLEEEEKAKFQSTLSSLLKKLGLGPEKIQQRNLYFDDFFKDQTEDILDNLIKTAPKLNPKKRLGLQINDPKKLKQNSFGKIISKLAT
jgi:hypothetical protein